MSATTVRPQQEEFAPYYASYIARVPQGVDVVEQLERQRVDMLRFLGSLPGPKVDHRYGADKWTVREVIGHLIDGERIFSYRSMRVARNDPTPLPGFDENAYVPAGEFGRRPIDDLAEEYDAVRRATIALGRSFTPAMATRRGTANNNPISARALLWIAAGHELHHRAILAERYGVR